MRTVTFKSVLDGVLTRMGLDPLVTADAATKAAVAIYVEDRHREAWESQDWPETRVIEERVYRRRFEDLAPEDIGLGDVVFHAADYWEALIANPTAEPGTDDAEWAVAEDFERYVALDQTGETLISEVVAIWDGNPRVGFAEQVPFELTENGAQVGTDAPVTVWVEFSLRVPEFWATAWATATDYTTGDLVLFTDGHCYQAARASTGVQPAGMVSDDWVRQPVLYVISRFVERAAYADTLAEDGQQAKGDRELGLAYRALEDELAKVALKQGQTRRITVRTQ